MAKPRDHEALKKDRKNQDVSVASSDPELDAAVHRAFYQVSKARRDQLLRESIEENFHIVHD